MTFQNSILSGTTLVRDSIQSENFVAGTSGWSIDRDGSAEFASLSARGAVYSDNGTETSFIDGGTLGVYRNDNSISTFMQSNLIEAFFLAANYGAQMFLDSAYIHLRWYLTRRSFIFDADGYLHSSVPGSNPGTGREAWNGFTFQNGWANFGGGYSTCAFKKDALGWVNFKGVAAPGVLAAGTVIANLPAGYRPLETQQWHYYGGANTILEFQTNGNVVIATPGGHPAGGALVITGFRFPVV